MTDKLEQIGRVMLRREGPWWVARFGEVLAQQGATEIARVLIAPAQADPAIKEHFIQLCRLIVASAAKSALGEDLVWKEPVPGPEQERAGRS